MQVNRVFSKSYFWIIFSLLSLCSLYFGLKLLEDVSPFLNINLSMSRSDANMQAQRLNEKFSWVANSSKLATAFTTDQYSINYISLADKTNTKLQDMLSAGI